jgi:uridine kinase
VKFLEPQKELFLSVLRHPVFLWVLAAKIVSSLIFVSDIPADLFVPFLSYFAENPTSNPYQHFFELGILKSFPYPALMLFIMGIPFLMFSFVNSPETLSIHDLGLLRLPLLLADILILLILVYLNPAKKKLVMYLYWLSPIVFYINYIHGQLDIIPIALLLLSLVLLFKEKLLWSAATLGFSLATKSHILVIIPFFILYLWKRKYDYKELIKYTLTILITYGIFLLPYISSTGFFQLVYLAQEQFRLFDLAITFSEGLVFYVVIAVYLYIVFKALTLRKITKNILLMFIGVTFTILVTLVRPAQGWYMWCVPFLVYFFVRQKNNLQILYWGFGLLYLAYFLIIPNSDFFRVFQFIAPGIASLPAPRELLFTLIPYGENISIGIVFTLLSSALIYIAYLMFKYGIKTSILFQEKAGVPVIGLSGDSGAGKSTTTKFLREMLGESNLTIIQGDDIHRWERGHQKWSTYTHLNPISNRLHTHYSHIAELKNGKPISRAHYDHSTGKFTEQKIIKPRNYIIDEGLHSFLIDNKSLHDLKIYLDPDPKLNRYWKIDRDVSERGYQIDKVLETLERRKPDREKYILPQKDLADLVITVLPATDAKDSEDFKNVSNYSIQFTIKTDINLDPLLETIEDYTDLSVEFEYTNHTHQKMILSGKITADIFSILLKKLDIDYTEYGIKLDFFRDGVDGLIQLVIMYCLDEKLKSKFEHGKELYG